MCVVEGGRACKPHRGCAGLRFCGPNRRDYGWGGCSALRQCRGSPVCGCFIISVTICFFPPRSKTESKQSLAAALGMGIMMKLSLAEKKTRPEGPAFGFWESGVLRGMCVYQAVCGLWWGNGDLAVRRGAVGWRVPSWPSSGETSLGRDLEAPVHSCFEPDTHTVKVPKEGPVFLNPPGGKCPVYSREWPVRNYAWKCLPRVSSFFSSTRRSSRAGASISAHGKCSCFFFKAQKRKSEEKNCVCKRRKT